jgi:hypothetical protein
MKKKLLPIIQAEYYNFFERKGKFETKSIGFIAFVSLLLTISWTIFLSFYVEKNILIINKRIFIIFEISLNYWTLLVIIHALIAIWPRKIKKIDKDEIIINAFNIKKNEDYNLKLLSTYIDIIEFNSHVLIKVEFHNQLSSLYLIFVFFIFIMQIIFYFLIHIMNSIF